MNETKFQEKLRRLRAENENLRLLLAYALWFYAGGELNAPDTELEAFSRKHRLKVAKTKTAVVIDVTKIEEGGADAR